MSLTAQDRMLISGISIAMATVLPAFHAQQAWVPFKFEAVDTS